MSEYGVLKAYQDGVKKGEELARLNTRVAILTRVWELKSCGKNDNCSEIADLLTQYIDEFAGDPNGRPAIH